MIADLRFDVMASRDDGDEGEMGRFDVPATIDRCWCAGGDGVDD